jgi:hypothetical protein
LPGAWSQADAFCWCERSRAADFAVRTGRVVAAIEVKSGRGRESRSGLAAFGTAFKAATSLLVGDTASRWMSSCSSP